MRIKTWVPVLALSLVLSVMVVTASAVPTPQEGGWTVRKVTDGFGLNFNGLAFDPVSTDLFTTDFNLQTIYRVTQAGVKTAIYSASDISFDEMAFDPTARILYFGGVDQVTLRKITEFGVFLEDVTAPAGLTGMAFAPDGNLYVNFANESQIARYNEGDDTFTIVHTLGGGLLEGLSFDPAGNAFVADYGGNAELKVSPGGTITTLDTIAGPVGSTYGDGSMFITNQSGTIWRVAPDGSGSTVFADGHVGCSGIHFAGNGNLYVNDHGDGSLWEYTQDTVSVEESTWGRIKSRYR